MKVKTKLILMSAAAIAGVGTTAVLSFNAGKEFDSLYEMYITELNYSSDNKSDVFKRYLPLFIKLFAPAFGAAAATIAMVILMAKFSMKTQAALMGALAIATTKLDVLNSEKDDQVAVEQEEEFLNKAMNEEECKKISEEAMLLYEPYTGLIFTTTKEKIDKALRHANKKLQNNYIVRLESILYDMAGSKARTQFGANMGWEMDNEKQMYMWRKCKGPLIDIYLNRSYDVHGRTILRVEWNVAPSLIID